LPLKTPSLIIINETFQTDNFSENNMMEICLKISKIQMKHVRMNKYYKLVTDNLYMHYVLMISSNTMVWRI